MSISIDKTHLTYEKITYAIKDCSALEAIGALVGVLLVVCARTKDPQESRTAIIEAMSCPQIIKDANTVLEETE